MLNSPHCSCIILEKVFENDHFLLNNRLFFLKFIVLVCEVSFCKFAVFSNEK